MTTAPKLHQLFNLKSKTPYQGYDYLVCISGYCTKSEEFFEVDNGWIGYDFREEIEYLTPSQRDGIEHIRIVKVPPAGYSHAMAFTSFADEDGTLQPFVTTDTGCARKPDKIIPLKRWDRWLSQYNDEKQ